MASQQASGNNSPHPVIDMHDAHKSSQEAKRDADHYHKWKRGSRIPGTEGAKPHPVMQHRNDGLWYEKQGKAKFSYNAALREKAFAQRHPGFALDPGNDFPRGVLHSASVTSVPDGDEYGSLDSIQERGCPHGEPDAGIAYSFDHATGPNDGSNIFTQALGNAVVRFEDKQTRKLVRDEYDVVTTEEEDEHVAHGPQVEDDFEILGHFES